MPRTDTESNQGFYVPFHITMIAAVLQDKKLILKESTLVGKHWEVSGQKKFLDLSVENVPLASKMQAIREPACRLHASAMPQGSQHFWAS